MRTKFAVVGSNLFVTYEEIKMFATSTVISTRFVAFFIFNFFRVLDGIFHKWLNNFDIQPFYNMIDNFDPDLKFTFQNPSKFLNFL